MNYSKKLLANISVNSLYQNPALSSKMHTQEFQFSEWGINNGIDYEINQYKSVSFLQNRLELIQEPNR